MKITIIDDDLEFGHTLAKYLNEQMNNLEIKIKTDDYGDYFDELFFLDIDMPKTSGITLAQKIKSINKNAIIIYVSFREDLVFEALQTFPYYFLRKKHLHNELGILLKKINKLNITTSLTINYQNNSISLPLQEIIFLAKEGSYLIIKTTSMVYKTRHSFKQLRPQLSPNLFGIVSQGFMANFKHIKTLTKEKVIMEDNTTSYFSRGKYNPFIIAYIECLENS